MKKLLLTATVTAAALAASASASAREKILIADVIPYANADVGSPALQAQCDWNRKLPKGIVKNSDGRVAIAKGPLDQQAGATLVITITEAHIRGGGVYTGDKSARVEGELRRGGEVLARFDLRGTTEGSVGACGAATAVGRQLAKDVGAWVRRQPALPPPAAK